MALQPFRVEQLNYFRFAYLVINEFPKALRQTFRSMWDNTFGHLPGYQRWDDSTAARNLFLVTEGGKTRVPINRSFDEWDCTALFQATIYARTFALPDSKGHHRTLSQLYVKSHKLRHGMFHTAVESPGGNDAETFSLSIDQLRLLRNALCHKPSSEIDKMTFDRWVQHAKDAFKALGVKTDAIDTIGGMTEVDFPTEKVRELEKDIREASQAENRFLREEVEDRLSDIAQSIQELQDGLKRTEAERKEEFQSLNDNLKEELRNTMEKSKEKSEEKPTVSQEVTGRTTLGAEEITRSYLPPNVPHFVGRQKECDEIIDHITSGCTRIVSIWGSPGFGKTSAAISVGNRLVTQEGWPIYFVSLRGLQSKVDLTSKLLSFLKHSVTTDNQSSQRLTLDDELCSRFAEISGPLLLIFDNADELLEKGAPEVKEQVIHLLEEILRRNKSVKFLVTTRESFEYMNVRLEGHQSVRIGPLEVNSSQELVRELLPNASTHDCLSISQLCGHVPLALRLACSLISGDDALSVSQCLRDFIESKVNIIELLDNPDYPSSLRLKFLFESSFQRLSQQEKESLVSLCILPEDFDLRAAAAVLGKTPIEAKVLLQSLRRKSLLDSSSRPVGSFSMHTLIKSFTIEKGEREMEQTFRNSRARFYEFYISLFEKLNCDFLTGHSMSAYEEFYAEKQNILRSLTESCSDAKTADLVFNVLVKAELFLDSLFWLLSEAANFNKIYDSALEAARDGHGNDMLYRRLLVSRAFSEITWGRRGKTRELLSEAEEIQANSSSVTAGEKGKRLCYLGFYQLVIGQTQNGVQCLREAQALSSLDKTTEGTILRIIVFQVLTVYYQFKTYSISSAYFYSKALQECRTLRERHVHLLVVPAVQSMRRMTTDETKRSPYTVASVNQPLELQVIFLVSEVTKHFAHADINKSLGNFVFKMLTDIESELGNCASLGLFSVHRMVVIMLRIFCKSEDTRIVIARERISYHVAALEQCKQKGSENNDKENLAISCEMHKDALAKSYLDIGFAQRDKEDFDSALQSEQRALEIRLEQFGEDHSSTADCYLSLGATQYAKGDFASSLHSTQRALDITRKLFGDEHPRTACSTAFLGAVQHKLHEISLALQSKLRALDIRLRLFGEEHSSTADSYYSLGVTQHEAGDIDAALKSQQRALDIKLKLFREEQFNSLDGYFSLGIKQNELGDYSSDRTEWLDILDYK